MSNHARMIYIGVTRNLDQRVFQHKNGVHAGFTKKFQMKKLVYVEPYPDMLSAIAREKQWKNWSRGKKIILIEQRNPEWLDLSPLP